MPMSGPTNWCEFFRKIEENPNAKIQGLTIGKLYQAREHIRNCDTCYNITERVAAMVPKDPPIRISEN